METDNNTTGAAAIQATENAAVATEEAIATVRTEQEIALENAQARIDEAQALAGKITDAALASELGKQIEGLRAQCQQQMDSLRAETQSQLAEIRALAERRPEAASPSIVAVQSPSIPPTSDGTPTLETPPPTVSIVNPGDHGAVVLPVPPAAPPPRKKRVI